MKPNSQLSRQPSRLDEARSSSRQTSNHPSTDYRFHAPTSELQAVRAGSSQKRTRPVFAPGFRDLSNEFLGAETKRSYVAEVLLFAVIVAVSAWPMVSMVQALAQLAK
jgi:hypothetical protein